MSSTLRRRALAGVASVTAAALLAGCTFGSGETRQTVPLSTSSGTTTTYDPARPSGNSAAPSPTASSSVSSSSTSTPSTSTTSTLPPTTTTTIPLVTEGAVVIISNASGVTGAAAKLSEELGRRGFHLGNATNAAGVEERLEVSKVYFLPAGAEVAASIGRLMGDIAVSRMPTPVSITGGPAALGEATVVVMLGKDLAGNDPIVRR